MILVTAYMTVSASLVPVPPIGDAVVLTPASYADWASMLTANPDKDDYLLTPGDYTGWGALHVNDRSGTAQRPRTFRYHNPTDNDDGVHPCNRASHAYVGSIRLHGDGPSAGVPTGTKRADHWVFQGLSNVDHPDSETVWTVYAAADYVTFDYCYITGANTLYGIRTMCSHTTVQRCVFSSSVRPFGVDSVAFGAGILADIPVTGIKMLDCEVFDYGDAFGAVEGTDVTMTEFDFLVEGNDFYQTGAKYFDGGRQCDAENGLDVKLGSDAVQSIIRNNRMWGFRRNGVSSPGDVMTLHRACRNLLIEDNICGEAPIGIRSVVWPSGYPAPEQPRNIVVRNNQLYDIKRYHPDDLGPAALWSEIDTVHEGNELARCDYAIPVAPAAGYRAGGPTFTDNVRINTPDVQPSGSLHPNPYEDSLNSAFTWSPVTWDRYERKRWTGREFADGATVSTTSYPTIRNSHIDQIEAITPAKQAQTKFRLHRAEQDFGEWVAANASACFRRFEFTSDFDVEVAGTTNGDIEMYEQSAVVLVAYPAHWAKYGAGNMRALDDLIDSDREQLDQAIGIRGYLNYPAGLEVSRIGSSSIDRVEGAWILRLDLLLQYDRSV